MKKIFLLLLLFTAVCHSVTAQQKIRMVNNEVILADSLENVWQLLEELRNQPNIEIGRGITFRPDSNRASLTLRFRMQNLLSLTLNDDFSLTNTEAMVRRLRLRLDGHLYSPKLVYSIQLGFSSRDTADLPNDNTNIILDAMAYYIPNYKWSIGFGQTKIRTHRAQINSSGALQFADRSIVNNIFQLDRDFGFFGEYHMKQGEGFNITAKGSITLGEGRNWGSSSNSGFAYTGRLELFPLGRFKGRGEIVEGTYQSEEQPRIMLAGAYSFNHKAQRIGGSRGAIMPNGETRNIGNYYLDFVLKYRNFALNTDFMGRNCSEPFFDTESSAFIYRGEGLNIQGSVLLANKWELALRNSTLFPDREVQPLTGYKRWNQTTLGITRYIIGHSLKVQADVSYNSYNRLDYMPANYDNRWMFRFQLELGL